MGKFISTIRFKDVVLDTKSFIVFAGSGEDYWNSLIAELLQKTNDSFFLGTTNEYGVDCGWYLKYEDIEPIIQELKLKIARQSMDYIPIMMNNYNKIIEFIKSKIDCDLELLKQCKVDCFYRKNDLCCNAKQEEISPNNKDCKNFEIPDYHEQLKIAKKLASDRIKTMNLQELQKLLPLIK